MNSIFDKPIPFSDYVILYFVDKFGVNWLDFYHIILVIVVGFAIGGWVLAFYSYIQYNRCLNKAQEKEDML